MFCLCLARVEFLPVPLSCRLSSRSLTLMVSSGDPPTLMLGLSDRSRSSTLELRTFHRLLRGSPDQASLLDPERRNDHEMVFSHPDILHSLVAPLRLSVADLILDLADLRISTNLASCRVFPSPSLTVSTWMSSSVAGPTLFLVVSL